MGKLTSYILGMTTAVLVGYYILSSDYSAIINWLGPVIGSDIIFPLSFLYLLLGNFLLNPILLVAWAAIGVAVGLGARKGSRAIGAAVGVYFSLWGFLALSSLAVLEKFSGINFANTGALPVTTTAAFSIPPLPPGVTISAILTEPLLQAFLTLFFSLGGISSLGGLTTTGSGTASSATSLSSLSSTLVSTFVPYLAVNLIVFLLISGIVGWLVHKGLYHNKQRGNSDPAVTKVKKKYKKVKTKKVTRKVSHLAALAPLTILAVLVLLLAMFPALIPFHSLGSGVTSGIQDQSFPPSDSFKLVNQSLYSAGFVMGAGLSATGSSSSVNSSVMSLSYGAGFVGKYGNYYNIYAFVNASASSGSGFPSPGLTSSQVLSAVFITNNTQGIFKALAQDGAISSQTFSQLQSNSYYNLIPQGLVVEAFQGNLSETSKLALQSAVALAGNAGFSAPQQFLAISIPATSVSGTVMPFSIFAYTFNTNLYASEKQIAGSISPYIANDGMYSAFHSGINDGYLVPGNTTSSVDGSIFIAGSLNLGELPSTFGNLTSIFNATKSQGGTGQMVFMGGLFVKENVLHSSSTFHTISASQVFNYAGNVSFGNNHTAYAMSLLYPAVNTSGGQYSTQYNSLMYATVGNLTPFGAAASTSYQTMNYSSLLNLSNVTVKTNATFPAELVISQSVISGGGNLYNVTITLTNNDTDNMSSVSISANPFIGTYGPNAVLQTGSMSAQASSLLPGQSLTVKYSVILKGVGTYILADPVFNYTLNNNSFSILGNALTSSVPQPSVWNSTNQVELVSFTTLASLVNFPLLVQQVFPGVYFFDIIFALIVALDIYIEYRAFRRWSTVRAQKKEPPMTEGPSEPEEPQQQ